MLPRMKSQLSIIGACRHAFTFMFAAEKRIIHQILLCSEKLLYRSEDKLQIFSIIKKRRISGTLEMGNRVHVCYSV